MCQATRFAKHILAKNKLYKTLYLRESNLYFQWHKRALIVYSVLIVKRYMFRTNLFIINIKICQVRAAIGAKKDKKNNLKRQNQNKKDKTKNC